MHLIDQITERYEELSDGEHHALVAEFLNARAGDQLRQQLLQGWADRDETPPVHLSRRSVPGTRTSSKLNSCSLVAKIGPRYSHEFETHLFTCREDRSQVLARVRNSPRVSDSQFSVSAPITRAVSPPLAASCLPALVKIGPRYSSLQRVIGPRYSHEFETHPAFLTRSSVSPRQ